MDFYVLSDKLVDIKQIRIKWILLVWLFRFSNISVVKEHLLQINYSLSITFEFQTMKMNENEMKVEGFNL